PEGLFADVHPELAVALELALVEPLIRRRLMRELGNALRELDEILRFVAGQRWLQINQVALLVRGSAAAQQRPFVFAHQPAERRAAWNVVVVDSTDDAVRLTDALVPLADAMDVDVDLDAEVGAALAYERGQILAKELVVLTSVAQDDVAAAAANEL